MTTRKALILTAVLASIQFTAQAQEVQPSVGEVTLSVAKFIGAYVATNGSQSVSSGFTGFGTGRIAIAPVLSQSLAMATVGKIGVDTLTLGIEHATSFQPSANRECLGAHLQWHIWKLSKVGKIFALDFNDLGVETGLDAPVEWFTGNGIGLSTLVVRVGGFIHF